MTRVPYYSRSTGTYLKTCPECGIERDCDPQSGAFIDRAHRHRYRDGRIEVGRIRPAARPTTNLPGGCSILATAHVAIRAGAKRAATARR